MNAGQRRALAAAMRAAGPFLSEAADEIESDRMRSWAELEMILEYLRDMVRQAGHLA